MITKILFVCRNSYSTLRMSNTAKAFIDSGIVPDVIEQAPEHLLEVDFIQICYIVFEINICRLISAQNPSNLAMN
jgi:hypothetical protein